MSGVEVVPSLGLESRLKLMALGLKLGRRSFLGFGGSTFGSVVRANSSLAAVKGPALDLKNWGCEFLLTWFGFLRGWFGLLRELRASSSRLLQRLKGRYIFLFSMFFSFICTQIFPTRL
jgi:hypothetical protein